MHHIVHIIYHISYITRHIYIYIYITWYLLNGYYMFAAYMYCMLYVMYVYIYIALNIALYIYIYSMSFPCIIYEVLHVVYCIVKLHIKHYMLHTIYDKLYITHSLGVCEIFGGLCASARPSSARSGWLPPGAAGLDQGLALPLRAHGIQNHAVIQNTDHKGLCLGTGDDRISCMILYTKAVGIMVVWYILGHAGFISSRV